MNKKTMMKAKSEALRFLAAVEVVERSGDLKIMTYGASKGHEYYSASKHTGAAKRASMDLTRALADLRRPA